MEKQKKFDHWYERMFEDDGYDTPEKKIELIKRLKKQRYGNRNKNSRSSYRNI